MISCALLLLNDNNNDSDLSFSKTPRQKKVMFTLEKITNSVNFVSRQRNGP